MDNISRIVQFLHGIELTRHPKDTLTIHNRERFLVTVILSMLSDPKHPIGQPIMRELMKVYIERGGLLPVRGQLSRFLRETDQFDFAAQWLYDSGMRVRDIANVLGCSVQTIYKILRFNEQQISDEENTTTVVANKNTL